MICARTKARHVSLIVREELWRMEERLREKGGRRIGVMSERVERLTRGRGENSVIICEILMVMFGIKGIDFVTFYSLISISIYSPIINNSNDYLTK